MKPKSRRIPSNLLNAIEEHSLNYEETRYDMSIVSDAIRSLFTIRQNEGEDLVTYTSRFKTLRNIAVNKIGDEIQLTNVVNNDLMANASRTKDVSQKKAWERLMAFVYLDRADKSKYGQFLGNLKVQNSLGNDQYPESVDEAHSVLSVQKIEKQYKQKLEKKSPWSNTDTEKSEDDGQSKKSFSQRPKTTITCYCCGKKGHAVPECRDIDKIPRKEWFINRAMSNMQDSGEADDD
jgi:hypothetical protein